MKTSPAEFVRQVKNEAKKVTWPTKQETTKAAIMILVVVSIMAAFLFVVDWGVSSLVDLILHMGIRV